MLKLRTSIPAALIILFAMFITACGADTPTEPPNDSFIQTAVAQTVAARPTNTTAPVLPEFT
ncbi:MAG: hypothetical protein HYZ23_08135, partial [Chloroflexi bacterium]|nr:hypothetical protein [Chloroflexota bacterium]